jgi:uncharacterized integral membrane protein
MRDDHDRTPQTDPQRAASGEDGLNARTVSAEEKQLASLRRARQARVAKVLVALGIIAILIIFVISNSQQVPVDFVFLTRHPRLIWVMFACAVLGGIAGYLIGKPGRQILPESKKTEDEKKRT